MSTRIHRAVGVLALVAASVSVAGEAAAQGNAPTQRYQRQYATFTVAGTDLSELTFTYIFGFCERERVHSPGGGAPDRTEEGYIYIYQEDWSQGALPAVGGAYVPVTSCSIDGVDSAVLSIEGVEVAFSDGSTRATSVTATLTGVGKTQMTREENPSRPPGPRFERVLKRRYADVVVEVVVGETEVDPEALEVIEGLLEDETVVTR